MRMLILPEHNEENIKKVATIAGLAGDEEMKKQKLQDKLKTVSRKAANINVLFIVDATQSMGPYKNVVQNSIENITSKIESDFKSANLKFAVGAYRAYGDKYGTYEKLNFKNAKDAIEDLENITFNSGN